MTPKKSLHPEHIPGAAASSGEMVQATNRIFSEFLARIGEDPLNEVTANRLTEEFLRKLPKEIVNGINEDDLNRLKLHISSGLLKLFAPGASPSEDEVRAFSLDLILELSAHHTAGIILEAPLYEEDLGGQSPKEFETELVHSGKKISIVGKRVGQKFLLVISSVASFFGGMNLVATGRDRLMDNVPFFEQAAMMRNPDFQTAANVVGGAITLILTSWVLSSFKSKISEVAFSTNASFAEGAKKYFADIWNNPDRSKAASIALAGTAAVMLGYDLVSNADGFVTLTAGNLDEAKQIDVRKENIQAAVDAIRGQLKGMPQELQDQALVFGQTEVSREKGGKSATQKEGPGPMYHGKMAVLTDEMAGAAYFAAHDDALSRSIWTAAQGSGFIGDTYGNMGEHFKGIADSSLLVVDANLGEVETLSASLDPTSTREVNDARLRELQSKFDEIRELVGEDGTLKTDLETATTKYNAFLRSLGEVAGANISAYPDYQASEVPEFQLPNIEIPENIAQVDVKGMDYKTTWNLVSEMMAQGRRFEAALWASLAFLFGIVMSYADDLLFFSSVRKTHVVDRTEIKRRKKAYVEPLIAGLTNAFDVLLNGPYMLTAKREPVHPRAVREEVDCYLEERIESEKPNGYVDLMKYLKELRHALKPGNREILSNTEEANEFNVKIAILWQIMTDPKHLRVVLDRILLNNPKLKDLRGGNVVQTVQEENTAHLSAENIRFEKADLDTIEARLPDYPQEGASREQLAGVVRDITALLDEMSHIRRTEDPTNKRMFARLHTELTDREKSCINSIGDSLIKDVYGVEVRRKHKSIREARERCEALSLERDNLTHEFSALERFNDQTQAAFQGKREEIEGEQEALTLEEQARDRDAQQTLQRRRLVEENKRLVEKVEEWKNQDAALIRVEAGRGKLERLNHFLALFDLSPLLGSAERDKSYERGQLDTTYQTHKTKLESIRDSYSYLNNQQKADELNELIANLEIAKSSVDSYLDSLM